jgi:hypothetical protein
MCTLRERLHIGQKCLSLLDSSELPNMPFAATEAVHKVQNSRTHDGRNVPRSVQRTLCSSTLLCKLLDDLRLEAADTALMP